MGFTASYSIVDECLIVEVKGAWVLEAGLNMTVSIRKESDTLGLKKILVDFLGVEGTYSTMDRYQIGMKITEVFNHKYKVAVVIRSELTSRFTEDVVVNRGGHFRVLTSREEAFQWLRDDNDPKGIQK